MKSHFAGVTPSGGDDGGYRHPTRVSHGSTVRHGDPPDRKSGLLNTTPLQKTTRSIKTIQGIDTGVDKKNLNFRSSNILIQDTFDKFSNNRSAAEKVFEDLTREIEHSVQSVRLSNGVNVDGQYGRKSNTKDKSPSESSRRTYRSQQSTAELNRDHQSQYSTRSSATSDSNRKSPSMRISRSSKFPSRLSGIDGDVPKKKKELDANGRTRRGTGLTDLKVGDLVTDHFQTQRSIEASEGSSSSSMDDSDGGNSLLGDSSDHRQKKDSFATRNSYFGADGTLRKKDKKPGTFVDFFKKVMNKSQKKITACIQKGSKEKERLDLVFVNKLKVKMSGKEEDKLKIRMLDRKSRAPTQQNLGDEEESVSSPTSSPKKTEEKKIQSAFRKHLDVPQSEVENLINPKILDLCKRTVGFSTESAETREETRKQKAKEEIKAATRLKFLGRYLNTGEAQREGYAKINKLTLERFAALTTHTEFNKDATVCKEGDNPIENDHVELNENRETTSPRSLDLIKKSFGSKHDENKRSEKEKRLFICMDGQCAVYHLNQLICYLLPGQILNGCSQLLQKSEPFTIKVYSQQATFLSIAHIDLSVRSIADMVANLAHDAADQTESRLALFVAQQDNRWALNFTSKLDNSKLAPEFKPPNYDEEKQLGDIRRRTLGLRRDMAKPKVMLSPFLRHKRYLKDNTHFGGKSYGFTFSGLEQLFVHYVPPELRVPSTYMTGIFMRAASFLDMRLGYEDIAESDNKIMTASALAFGHHHGILPADTDLDIFSGTFADTGSSMWAFGNLDDPIGSDDGGNDKIEIKRDNGLGSSHLDECDFERLDRLEELQNKIQEKIEPKYRKNKEMRGTTFGDFPEAHDAQWVRANQYYELAKNVTQDRTPAWLREHSIVDVVPPAVMKEKGPASFALRRLENRRLAGFNDDVTRESITNPKSKSGDKNDTKVDQALLDDDMYFEMMGQMKEFQEKKKKREDDDHVDLLCTRALVPIKKRKKLKRPDYTMNPVDLITKLRDDAAVKVFDKPIDHIESTYQGVDNEFWNKLIQDIAKLDSVNETIGKSLALKIRRSIATLVMDDLCTVDCIDGLSKIILSFNTFKKAQKRLSVFQPIKSNTTRDPAVELLASGRASVQASDMKNRARLTRQNTNLGRSSTAVSANFSIVPLENGESNSSPRNGESMQQSGNDESIPLSDEGQPHVANEKIESTSQNVVESVEQDKSALESNGSKGKKSSSVPLVQRDPSIRIPSIPSSIPFGSFSFSDNDHKEETDAEFSAKTKKSENYSDEPSDDFAIPLHLIQATQEEWERLGRTEEQQEKQRKLIEEKKQKRQRKLIEEQNKKEVEAAALEIDLVYDAAGLKVDRKTLIEQDSKSMFGNFAEQTEEIKQEASVGAHTSQNDNLPSEPSGIFAGFSMGTTTDGGRVYVDDKDRKSMYLSKSSKSLNSRDKMKQRMTEIQEYKWSKAHCVLPEARKHITDKERRIATYRRYRKLERSPRAKWSPEGQRFVFAGRTHQLSHEQIDLNKKIHNSNSEEAIRQSLLGRHRQIDTELKANEEHLISLISGQRKPPCGRLRRGVGGGATGPGIVSGRAIAKPLVVDEDYMMRDWKVVFDVLIPFLQNPLEQFGKSQLSPKNQIKVYAPNQTAMAM